MSELMQDRYRKVKPRRRIVLTAATTALAVLFLGWLFWAASFQVNPAIRATLTRYDIVDAHEVRIQVQATFRDDSIEGSCLVRAIAVDHTPVGELNLTAATLRAESGTWISMRTERAATTVELIRCTEQGS